MKEKANQAFSRTMENGVKQLVIYLVGPDSQERAGNGSL